MTIPELARMRLSSQRIAGPAAPSVADTVHWMGAVQAQDYSAALWAIGLRTEGTTAGDVEEAIARREIVRTWPMRGTLHFISPELLRPVLRLCAPRIFQRSAGRHKQLGIDDEVIARARKVVSYAISAHGPRTRAELYAAMAADGLRPDGQRGIAILSQLAREAVICHGAHQGKQPTFVLLDEWIPETGKMTEREALVELARRYFTSHGPATVHDFAWWSNLKVTEARSGLEANRERLEHIDVAGKQYWFSADAVIATSDWTCLLPGFDEFILGYTDRTAVLTIEQMRRIVPGDNGMFMPAIVAPNGEILGTWGKSLGKGTVAVAADPFDEMSEERAAQFRLGAERYAAFLGLPLQD